MTDRQEAIAVTVKERPIMSLEDELNRIRDQRDALFDACDSALIALNHPSSERWRETALADIKSAIAKVGWRKGPQ